MKAHSWQLRVFRDNGHYEVLKRFKTEAAALRWLDAQRHPVLLILPDVETTDGEPYTCAIPWAQLWLVDLLPNGEGD